MRPNYLQCVILLMLIGIQGIFGWLNPDCGKEKQTSGNFIRGALLGGQALLGGEAGRWKVPLVTKLTLRGASIFGGGPMARCFISYVYWCLRSDMGCDYDYQCCSNICNSATCIGTENAIEPPPGASISITDRNAPEIPVGWQPPQTQQIDVHFQPAQTFSINLPALQPGQALGIPSIIEGAPGYTCTGYGENEIPPQLVTVNFPDMNAGDVIYISDINGIRAYTCTAN